METRLNILEKKVEDAEADLERLSALTCGIEKLEKRVQEIAQNNFILIHAVDDIEKATKVNEKNLDILFNQQYSFSCGLCEKEFESESLLREHTHSDHRSSKAISEESESRGLNTNTTKTNCCAQRCCAGTYSSTRSCPGSEQARQPGDKPVCCNHKLKMKF